MTTLDPPGGGSVRRVLLVSTSSGSQGGGELYLDGLAEGLTHLGCDVHSLLADHPRMDGMVGLLGRWGSVLRTDLITNTYDQRLRSLGAAVPGRGVARLAELLRQLQPDVIHVNKQNLEDGLDVLLAADRSGVPTVCTVHVTRGMAELGSALGRARDWVARRVLTRARCEYVAIAATCRRQLAGFLAGRIPESRLHAVPNGVRPAPAGDRAKTRAEWGCRPNDVVLGCVARIEAQKDPLFTLDLLAALPEHVRLVWVGDGRMRAEFEARALELGLTWRVHLDGWRKDARQRMAGFDAFVLPSAYEGFPFAVLEAMAAGLPCVVSDVDGTREAVAEGVTGWLCRPRDRDAWVGRLTQLAGDAALRKRMGRAGCLRVREQFSLEAMARSTLAVYDAAARRVKPQPVGAAR